MADEPNRCVSRASGWQRGACVRAAGPLRMVASWFRSPTYPQVPGAPSAPTSVRPPGLGCLAARVMRDECRSRWHRRAESIPATTAAPLTPGNFVAADESMSPPARPQQPGLGSGYRGAIGGRSRTPGPPRKPSPRGRGIDPGIGVRRSWGSLARMFACVENHVRKRGSNLPGRAECAVVIAAVESRSPPIEDAIHGPSEARGQALHPVRKGRGALRFDQQVDVIVLQRVVDDAEVSAFRDCAERALHRANQAHRSQRRHVPANANRHQARVTLRKLRTPAMPHPRSCRSLSPSTLPRPTPTHRHLQVQLELRSPLHTLDCGYVLVGSQERTSRLMRNA